MAGTIQLTSDALWQDAGIAALIDAAFLFLILRLIRPERFFQIRLPVVVSAGVVWGILGVLLVRTYWAGYYQYFYPSWMGEWGIYILGPAIGVVNAIIFYWIASWFRSRPVPVFFTLVGIEAILEHLVGIYRFHIMEIPGVQGVSPLSMLVFSVPEYIFYWGIILLLAFLIWRGYYLFKGGIGTTPV
jgi:hypothetical protein